jgi:DNA-binding IclR family transcriptional regulator
VLRLLAAAGRRGANLSTLALHTGLPVSSVHRLLAQLIDQRLTMQLEGSRLYALGPLAYELGLVAAQQFDIRQLCQPAMARLAAQSTETVYLVQRSGYEAVCVDLEQGPSTIRVVTLQVGSRRPLGLGAGGLAILANLPEEEIDEVLTVVMGSIERDWRFPEADLRSSLRRTQTDGHATIQNRITPGVTAVGKSFKDSLGQVFGAVTIAGLNSRMSPRRVHGLVLALDTAAHAIERALRGHQWARYSLGNGTTIRPRGLLPVPWTPC